MAGTWVCDSARTEDELLDPPPDCRIVVARNDVRVCERRGTQVVANSCIPCSLHTYPGLWASAGQPGAVLGAAECGVRQRTGTGLAAGVAGVLGGR